MMPRGLAPPGPGRRRDLTFRAEMLDMGGHAERLDQVRRLLADAELADRSPAGESLRAGNGSTPFGHRRDATGGRRHAPPGRTVSTALAIEPPVAGRVALSGPVAGRAGATARRRSRRPATGCGGSTSAAARLRHGPWSAATPCGSIVRRCGLGGGLVSANRRLVFGSEAASVEARWQGVPIDGAGPRPLPGNLGARLTGGASLTWDTALGLLG